MTENITSSQAFGGDWTSEKLNILSVYLTAYTTALKNSHFISRTWMPLQELGRSG